MMADIQLKEDVEDDFNISLKSIENAITDKTKAVLPVDIAGWPCDYDELNTLVESKKYHDEEVAEKGAPKKDLLAQIREGAVKKKVSLNHQDYNHVSTVPSIEKVGGLYT